MPDPSFPSTRLSGLAKPSDHLGRKSGPEGIPVGGKPRGDRTSDILLRKCLSEGRADRRELRMVFAKQSHEERPPFGKAFLLRKRPSKEGKGVGQHVPPCGRRTSVGNLLP